MNPLLKVISKIAYEMGYEMREIAPPPPPPAVPPPAEWYDYDGLRSMHDHSFMADPAFRRAYERGMRADYDYQWYWRAHLGLWAAHTASRLPGDFVECGVNRGFMSSAIMAYLDWNRQNRTFWLLDTFAGIDSRYANEYERERGERHLREGFYVQNADAARANFAEWQRAQIVVGAVPDTLPEVRAEQIAFLHLDMNCAPPEVAALHYFWPRLSTSAIILLDDYAYHDYRSQKLAMDEATAAYGVRVASLPTGQGLVVKT